MSGVLDFLFQGSPPPSVTKYGTAQQNIPQFMSDYTQGLLNKSNAVAGQPYQAYTAPRISGFTPDQLKAQQQTEASVGQYTPNISSALDVTQQALGYNAANASNPELSAAASINASGMAQPYANQAAQTFTGQNVQNYMNPYVNNVVNRIGELAGRNLSENLLPQVGSNFIRAGQFGSTGQQAAVGRALRDTQESALAAQNKALSDAYTTAGQLFGTDQSRQAQLASTMGNLGLGQQQNLGTLGQIAGNMSSQTLRDQLASAAQTGSLAQQGQAMNLKDLAALAGVGAEQQGQQQKSLDLAYQDFLNQRQYPQQQLDFMSSIIRGLPMSTSGATTNTGPLSNQYGPSGLAQILAGLQIPSTFS